MAVATLLLTACSNKVQAQTTSNMEINITIGNKTFTAAIDDSDTGRAFYDRLPMTLNMSELNGNEKYYYLNESLPTAPQYYGTIEAGDLMLYASSCIVLFYGQAGGYSYTRLGKLNSTEGLSLAVGSKSVSVTFSKLTMDIQETMTTGDDTQTYGANAILVSEKSTKGVYIKNGKKYIK